MISTVHYEEWLIINRPELSEREVARRVDVYSRKLHRRRADLISRTESCSAVSEGTLEGYDEANITQVGWCASAGACNDCAALDGKRFSLDEASGMIPFHPACRCAWIPVVK